MAPTDAQKRELAQLMLMAQEYLRRADPSGLRDVVMSDTTAAFLRGRLTAEDWSKVTKGADLASAAIRLASIEDVLRAVGQDRALYRDCRLYFAKCSKAADDARGRTCSDWFHIMLRDSIAHNEPTGQPKTVQDQRYEARQQCIAELTFGEAHDRLRRTEADLMGVLTANGVTLPSVER
jgi:hypothetical protein